jgi:hypothetical protein
VIITRAWSGQLPSEALTQGVRYAAEEAKESGGDGIEAVSAEVMLLRNRLERLEGN